MPEVCARCIHSVILIAMEARQVIAYCYNAFQQHIIGQHNNCTTRNELAQALIKQMLN